MDVLEGIRSVSPGEFQKSCLRGTPGHSVDDGALAVKRESRACMASWNPGRRDCMVHNLHESNGASACGLGAENGLVVPQGSPPRVFEITLNIELDTHMKTSRTTGFTGKLLPMAVIAAIGMSVGGASAATVTYEDSESISQSASGSLFLQKFNTTLGTLTGISVQLQLNDWSSVFTFTHNNSVTLAADSMAGVRVTLSGAGKALQATARQNLAPDGDIFFPGSGTETLTPTSPASASSSFSDNAAWALANGYVGSGNKQINFSGIQSQLIGTSGASTSNVLTQDMTGSVKALVTYTYDAAPVTSVPEPSSVLMCSAPALLGMGAFLRRFRSKRDASK